MPRKTRILGAAFLMALLASSSLGQGQADRPAGLEGELAAEFGSFGLGNQDYWISAVKFVPRALEPWYEAGEGYFVAEDDATLTAQIDLPAGAHITAITCYFYDDDAGGAAEVTLTKFAYDQLTQTPSTQILGGPISSIDTGGYQTVTSAYDVTIAYREGLALRNFYKLTATMPNSLDVRLRGCRIIWNRQVSAAPASATFADVPTNHPYFQFVEALVDSGITGGCGGGLYCVNSPITRGEMAVFLAAALGLHFPN